MTKHNGNNLTPAHRKASETQRTQPHGAASAKRGKSGNHPHSWVEEQDKSADGGMEKLILKNVVIEQPRAARPRELSEDQRKIRANFLKEQNKNGQQHSSVKHPLIGKINYIPPGEGDNDRYNALSADDQIITVETFVPVDQIETARGNNTRATIAFESLTVYFNRNGGKTEAFDTRSACQVPGTPEYADLAHYATRSVVGAPASKPCETCECNGPQTP